MHLCYVNCHTLAKIRLHKKRQSVAVSMKTSCEHRFKKRGFLVNVKEGSVPFWRSPSAPGGVYFVPAGNMWPPWRSWVARNLVANKPTPGGGDPAGHCSVQARACMEQVQVLRLR